MKNILCFLLGTMLCPGILSAQITYLEPGLIAGYYNVGFKAFRAHDFSRTLPDTLPPNMHQVIALDDSLGKVRNHACKTIPLSETVRQYVRAMERIDYSNCPGAFVTAFEQHREAWLALLPVTDKYPDLRGEMHDLFKQLETGRDAVAFKPLVKAIWDTWAEVENAIKK